MSSHSVSEEKHVTSIKTYVLIFILLMILTIITVLVSYVDVGMFNIVTAMSVASIKAAVVALFFMHLKFEDSLTWAFAIFPLTLLALLIGMTILDTFTRNYPI